MILSSKKLTITQCYMIHLEYPISQLSVSCERQYELYSLDYTNEHEVSEKYRETPLNAGKCLYRIASMVFLEI